MSHVSRRCLHWRRIGGRSFPLGARFIPLDIQLRDPKGETRLLLQGVDVLRIDSKETATVVEDSEESMECSRFGGL